ncbi:MAG: hypothetical protein AMJ42_03680 [Deltaproteobacteria bacterium DG_8]|nr:MAG: hypothetical protein AMJ42_03680 [Deltaproteobacteria bacterium DG_8]
MKISSIKTIFLVIVLLVLQFGCRPQHIEVEGAPYGSETFAKEYDEVWKTLEDIVEELRYPIRVKDKKRGVIETDWISIIRIRGTLRWNVRILLDRRNSGTMVRVYNRVEEPTDVRGKFKNKRGELKTDWEVSEERIADVDNILRMLSVRLEE